MSGQTSQSVHFCTAPDGVRIAYAALGSGPPLLKTGNWKSHLAADLESPVWRHWLEEFSRSCTFIRYDLRGCGLSDRELDDVSIEAQFMDLETVAEACGLERFAILALSAGCAPAVHYAARYPDRVTHLVMAGGYLGGIGVNSREPERVGRRKLLLDMVRHGWGLPNPAFREVFTSLFVPDGSPEQVSWFDDLQRICMSPEVAARVLEVSFEVDLRDVAPRVRAPTLVLHANRDAVVPCRQGRALAQAIPGARFVELDGCNHILMEDEPAWPHFLAEVRDFLGMEEGCGPRDPLAEEIASLTPRQQEVLDLVAEGLRDREIAERLSISENTVHRHMSDILERLDASSRAAAVARAVRADLI